MTERGQFYFAVLPLNSDKTEAEINTVHPIEEFCRIVIHISRIHVHLVSRFLPSFRNNFLKKKEEPVFLKLIKPD